MKNIFKLQLAVLIFGLFCFKVASSQENFIPGYVINNNNDTILGFVDYRNWSFNPNTIRFKREINDATIKFTPTNIKEFKVGQEIFVSAIVKTEISPLATFKLTYDPDLLFKVDTTFLQTQIRGKKSLFYYKNSIGRVNFYIEVDGKFELLVYKRYFIRHDAKRIAVENKKYMGQLTIYLQDCESINSKIEKTSYKKESLNKLFQYYYKCSASEMTYQKEIEKIRLNIGVLAGISSSSIDIKKQIPTAVSEIEYDQSINYCTGVFFDLILQRNLRKWSIYNEFLFTSYSFDGIYEEYNDENNYSLTKIELAYSNIKLTNLLRFKYPIGSVFMFFNTGISNGLLFNETNYKREEIKFHTTERVAESPALSETKKYDQAFVFGFGIGYKKLSLDVRYETGNGMSNNQSISTNMKKFFFLIGYRF